MRTMKLSSLSLIITALGGLGWLLPAATGLAATIDIQHTTLEKLLTDASQPGGRKFFTGKEGDACGWSYVRTPKVTTEGQRIKLSARLRGAFALSGGCFKMRDEIPVDVLAQPIYRNGILSLEHPEIRMQGEPAPGIYGGLLGGLLKLVQVPLKEKLVGLMTPSREGVTFKLVTFDVSNVEILTDRVRLTVNFDLEVQ